jgi:hypothetical protein
MVSGYDYTSVGGTYHAIQWKVECDHHDCPAQPTVDGHYITMDEAIEAWNRRAE